jgi:hypothetical protein
MGFATTREVVRQKTGVLSSVSSPSSRPDVILSLFVRHITWFWVLTIRCNLQLIWRPTHQHDLFSTYKATDATVVARRTEERRRALFGDNNGDGPATGAGGGKLMLKSDKYPYSQSNQGIGTGWWICASSLQIC